MALLTSKKGIRIWHTCGIRPLLGDQTAPSCLSLMQSEEREVIHSDPVIELRILAKCRFWGWLVDYFFPSWVERVTLCFKKALYAEKFCGESLLGSVWDEPPLLMSGERMKSSAPIFFSLPPSKDAELKGVFQKGWRQGSWLVGKRTLYRPEKWLLVCSDRFVARRSVKPSPRVPRIKQNK